MFAIKLNQSFYLKVGMLSVYLFSRIYLHFIGIGFDYHSFLWFPHVLNLDCLENNLLESLIYIHHQPPLYNLIIGVFLKVSSGHTHLFGVLMHLLHLSLGILTCVTIFEIANLLNINRIISFVGICIFMLLPDFIIYEKFLFYDFIVLCAISQFIYWYIKFLKTSKIKHLVLLLLVATFLIGVRSAFHIVWITGLISLLFITKRCSFKHYYVAVFLLLLPFSFFLKNKIIYDTLGTSSFMWTNMSKYYVYNSSVNFDVIEDSSTRKWISEGKIYDRADTYKIGNTNLAQRDSLNYPKIATLHNLENNYNINSNHIAFLRINQFYKKAVLQLIDKYPTIYLEGVEDGMTSFFAPTTEFIGFHNNGNINKMNNYYENYKYLIGVRESYVNKSLVDNRYSLKNSWKTTSLLAVLMYISTFLISIIYLASGKNIFIKKVFLFVLYNVTYIFLTSVMFEIGENMRQRYYSDIFIFMFVLLLLDYGYKRYIRFTKS